MNLLIVDDEIVAIRGMMEGIDWEECGVDGSIWTAYSAERAIRILNMQQVDLMLCDIEMPGQTVWNCFGPSAGRTRIWHVSFLPVMPVLLMHRRRFL